jgi:hypothetical protein
VRVLPSRELVPRTEAEVQSLLPGDEEAEELVRLPERAILGEAGPRGKEWGWDVGAVGTLEGRPQAMKRQGRAVFGVSG